MHTNLHLAPGLGDLLGGWFVLPQNPVGGGRPGYVPSLGELMPGSYPVPQNPLNRGLAAVGAGLSCGGGCGGGSTEPAHNHGGCGCGGGSGGCGCGGQVSPWSAFRGLSGMGFLGLDELGGDGGISPVWLVGGAAVLYLMMSSPGRSARKADILSAKADYARKRAKIQRSYSTRAAIGEKLGYEYSY